MYYKYKDIIESLPKAKNKKSSLWVKMIVRKISFIFTWIFINLKFTANVVSYLSIIIAVMGAIFMAINNITTRIIGMILINFWLVLDCVDGNIARCKKESSLFGSLVDAVGGYYAIAFSYFSIGIAAYYTTNMLINENKVIFIMLGALASIADILTRLLHQKKENTLLIVNGIENEEQIKKYTFNWIKTRIDKELGISGAFMPILILATIFNFLDIMIIGYVCFNVLVLIFMTIKILRDIEERSKNG